MNRNFEDRKSTKPRITSRENKSIIKALNMYGRVPEQWELLEEIERLNNIITKLKLCNSDYNNQICTLSSKLERINKYISNSNRELSVDSYYKFKDLSELDEIKEIIFDKTIKLGSE